MPKIKRTKTKDTRYSISVSGKIYDRLRAVVPRGGMASLVDEIVEAALDDPETLARIVARCRPEEAYS
jgi:hypothetical protein